MLLFVHIPCVSQMAGAERMYKLLSTPVRPDVGKQSGLQIGTLLTHKAFTNRLPTWVRRDEEIMLGMNLYFVLATGEGTNLRRVSSQKKHCRCEPFVFFTYQGN